MHCNDGSSRQRRASLVASTRELVANPGSTFDGVKQLGSPGSPPQNPPGFQGWDFTSFHRVIRWISGVKIAQLSNSNPKKQTTCHYAQKIELTQWTMLIGISIGQVLFSDDRIESYMIIPLHRSTSKYNPKCTFFAYGGSNKENIIKSQTILNHYSNLSEPSQPCSNTPKNVNFKHLKTASTLVLFSVFSISPFVSSPESLKVRTKCSPGSFNLSCSQWFNFCRSNLDHPNCQIWSESARVELIRLVSTPQDASHHLGLLHF